MSTKGAPKPIVVGVDGSPASSLAVRWAATGRSPARSPSRARAHLPRAGWHVVIRAGQQLSGGPAPDRRAVVRGARQAREVARESIELSEEFAFRSPADALMDMSAQAQNAPVAQLGTLASMFLGSVSTRLVHHAHCPVTVIHDDPPPPSRPEAPILVGSDNSPASDHATELAFDEAATRGVGLVVLHSWWSPGAFQFPGFDWEGLLPDVDAELGRRLDPSA